MNLTFPFSTDSHFLRVGPPAAATPYAVAGIAWDGATTNRPGARFGPRAVRHASHMLCDGVHPHFNVSPAVHLGDAGDLPLPNTALDTMRAALQPLAAALIARHHMAWIGGDHSITLPLLRAYRQQLGQPLTVIHFDAHCDTWANHFGEPSGHGTWVYEALREGLVLAAGFTQLGIRSPGLREAREHVADRGGQVFTARDLRGLESPAQLAPMLQRIRSRLQQLGNPPVYLSLDIDCLDPAFAPGTGTPEPGGLSSNQVLTVLEELCGSPAIRFVGMDCVEVAPAYDHAELTSHAAATFVWTYLCGRIAAAQSPAAPSAPRLSTCNAVGDSMNKAIDPTLMQAAESASQAAGSHGMDAHWMPFTANRQFKKAPRLLAKAHGMHYWDDKGRQILDAVAGLWCVNAGHTRPRIVKAIQDQAAEMDFAPPFQMGHPKAFELAERVAVIAPEGMDKVFFTNSGSEAVETALKMALAYHRVRGEASRTRLIGRERGYHGVNFGGISVGGMVANRKQFGVMLGGVDHLRHTHDLAKNAFSVGLPAHGAELADDLERMVALHDASTIAAVIVEPVAGSTGVLLPPQGYLPRLRDICTKHGILLIFDEVITGFGRTGMPFAAQTFGVTPDLITCAKGITNGAVPMGAVIAQRKIHDAFMTGPEGAIEFFHGYTYSSHPLACAAGIATLDTYAEEGLLTRAGEMQGYFGEAVHALRGEPNVIDVRNIGLVAGIELAPIAGSPTKRAFDIFLDCWQQGMLIRTTGDILALSPPLIVERGQVDQIVDTLRAAIRRAA